MTSGFMYDDPTRAADGSETLCDLFHSESNCDGNVEPCPLCGQANCEEHRVIYRDYELLDRYQQPKQWDLCLDCAEEDLIASAKRCPLSFLQHIEAYAAYFGWDTRTQHALDIGDVTRDVRIRWREQEAA